MHVRMIKMAELDLALKKLVQISYCNEGETKTQKRGEKLDLFVAPCNWDLAWPLTVGREHSVLH